MSVRAAELLPVDKSTVLFEFEVPNAAHLSTVLSLVKPVVSDAMSFRVQSRQGTSDILISMLKKDSTAFVSARVSCSALFYTATGHVQHYGDELVTVEFKRLRQALKGMSGNCAVVMYQLKPHLSTELYVYVRKEKRCTCFNIPILMENNEEHMVPLRYRHSLYLPVQQFREDLAVAHEMSTEAAENVTLSLYAVPDAPPSHMLFVITAPGLAGSKGLLYTYLGPAPALDKAEDDAANERYAVDNTTVEVRSAIDSSMVSTGGSVFSRNLATMTRLFHGSFRTKEILQVLTEIRNETYVEVFLKRAHDDTSTGAMPMLLRMSGGPDLCMQFLFPPADSAE